MASTDLDFYALDERVTRIALNLYSSTKKWREFVIVNFKRITKLRLAIRDFKPDVILSFLDTTNLRMLLASIGTGIPVIVEEHIDPTQNPVGRIVRFLRRLLYRRACAVVVLTPGIARWASSFVRSDATIPRGPEPDKPAVLQKRQAQAGKEWPPRNRYWEVGGAQKGFDMLLKAFAQCAQEYPGWTLKIVGDGSERDHLHALAAALQIGDRVKWERAVKEPEKELHYSDLFVLSSRYEGAFPWSCWKRWHADFQLSVSTVRAVREK